MHWASYKCLDGSAVAFVSCEIVFVSHTTMYFHSFALGTIPGQIESLVKASGTLAPTDAFHALIALNTGYVNSFAVVYIDSCIFGNANLLTSQNSVAP